jgi:hypothetical protein
VITLLKMKKGEITLTIGYTVNITKHRSGSGFKPRFNSRKRDHEELSRHREIYHKICQVQNRQT